MNLVEAKRLAEQSVKELPSSQREAFLAKAVLALLDRKIWVITWSTESSDRGVLGYFTTKPTEKQQLALKKKYFPDEVSESGAWYVYFDVEELTEEKLR
jgi:hypothetical protein